MNVKKRVKTLFEHSDDSLEAILIKNSHESFIDQNFFYVTGLNQGLFEDCCLILFPDGTVHAIVTPLEGDIAKNSDADIHLFHSKQDMTAICKDLLENVRVIGVNASSILYSEYQWISTHLKGKQMIDISHAFQRARMYKDADELHAIQKACTIADKVMEEITSFIKTNMTENELAAEIDYHLMKYGAHHPAFETIASFGPHTALPHYTHAESALKRGDFILCDFGACYNKYHSDITRTFVYGSASEKQKQVHKTVHTAQQQAMQMIQPGIQANSVHEQVKSFIDSTEYKDRFIHSTGHSLGLSVHDPGIGLYPSCQEVLHEQMILTVEPGIYIPGYGGVRIEDDIVITKDGCSTLTHTDRTLREL